MSAYATDESQLLGHLDVSKSEADWSSLTLCPPRYNNEVQDKYLSFSGTPNLAFTVQIDSYPQEIKLNEPQTFEVPPVRVFQFIPNEDISDTQLDVTVTSESADVPAYLKVSRDCKDVKDNIDDVDYKGESLRLSFAKKGRITLSKVSVPPLTDSTLSWFIGIAIKNASGSTAIKARKNVTLELRKSFDYSYAKPIAILVVVSSLLGAGVWLFANFCFKKDTTSKQTNVQPTLNQLEQGQQSSSNVPDTELPVTYGSMLVGAPRPLYSNAASRNSSSMQRLPRAISTSRSAASRFPALSSPASSRVHTYSSPASSRVPALSSPASSRVHTYSSPASSRVPALSSPASSRVPALSSPASSRVPALSSPASSRVPALSSPASSRVHTYSSPASRRKITEHTALLSDQKDNERARQSTKSVMQPTPPYASVCDQEISSTRSETDSLLTQQARITCCHEALLHWFTRGPKTYSYTTAIMGFALMIGAGQFVFANWHLMKEEGDRDNCYYNDFCYRVSHWHDIPFNLMISNLVYMSHGLILALSVWYMEAKLLRQYRKRPKRHRLMNRSITLANRDDLPPKQAFSIGYAFAWALIFEGSFSLVYHLCPSKLTFQFDTAFMFVIAGLTVILLHNGIEMNKCSSDGIPKSPVGAANFFLYFLVPLYIFNYLGTLRHSETELATPVEVSLFVFLVCWEVIIAIWAGKKLFTSPQCSKENLQAELCKSLWFSLGVGAPIVCFLYWENLPQAFLIVIIAETVFVILCTCCCKGIKCKFSCISFFKLLYVLVMGVLWALALYFFWGKPTTDKVETPEKSRNLNHDCVLLGFFDYHDIWHFLSSHALLMMIYFVMFMSTE